MENQIFKVKFVNAKRALPNLSNVRNVKTIHLDLKKNVATPTKAETPSSVITDPKSSIVIQQIVTNGPADIAQNESILRTESCLESHSDFPSDVRSGQTDAPNDVKKAPFKHITRARKKFERDNDPSIPVIKTESVEIESGYMTCYSDMEAIKSVEEILVRESTGEFDDRFQEVKCTSNETSVEGVYTNGIALLADIAPEIKDDKVLKCKFCPFESSREWEMKKHRIIHAGKKCLPCPFCSHVSFSKPRLITHIRVHTGERPFVCKFCPFKTKQKHDLKRHLRIHTGEKPFKCDLCSFEHSDKRALVVHRRSHTGEQPYQCEICSLSLTQKQQLVRHMRTHSGEKPFKCEFCLYRASRKHHLTNHMRTHTGEKPYKCHLCSYSAVQKFSLELHLKNHSENKTYKCAYCSYSSNRKKIVASHQTIHAKGVNM